jgi:hypothetical protein
MPSNTLIGVTVSRRPLEPDMNLGLSLRVSSFFKGTSLPNFYSMVELELLIMEI